MILTLNQGGQAFKPIPAFTSPGNEACSRKPNRLDTPSQRLPSRSWHIAPLGLSRCGLGLVANPQEEAGKGPKLEEALLAVFQLIDADCGGSISKLDRARSTRRPVFFFSAKPTVLAGLGGLGCWVWWFAGFGVAFVAWWFDGFGAGFVVWWFDGFGCCGWAGFVVWWVWWGC